MKRLLFLTFLISLSVVICISSISAQWIESGVPVSTSEGIQRQCFIVPDDSSGVIIVWEDRRKGFDSLDVYAQRVDGDGYVKWTIDGVAVCNATNIQIYARIVTDGDGGAIIVWGDKRSGSHDIYAQRLDRNGTSLWTRNGILVCGAQGDQHGPSIVSDGAGGAIIAWKDFRDNHDDYYVQRIDGSGTSQWVPSGVPISTVDVGYLAPIGFPDIISDGYGGVIIAWADRRNGPYMVHAQRVDADGNVLWAEDGVSVSDVVVRHIVYNLVSDGFHGTIITWVGKREDVLYKEDIYSQRIRSDGSVAWNMAGVPVCSSSEWATKDPRLTEISGGGVIITWLDKRKDSGDIYAQRVDSLGTIEWDANGIPICDEINGQFSHKIISDGEDGALISWKDTRNETDEIYIQRISNNGMSCWEADGIAFYTAPYSLEVGFQEMLMPDTESVMLTWPEDRRLESNIDIYLKKIFLDGTIPVSTLLKHSSASMDGNIVTIRWELSERDENITFFVLRVENGGGIFLETASQDISVDGYLYQFTDNTCSYGTSYRYRVAYLQDDKRHVLFETEPVDIPSIAVTLSQNSPNPFNPSTTIRYSVRERCHVKLEVLDVAGRKIYTLTDMMLEGGSYEASWDGCDSDGREVVSGVYFYQLKAGKVTISKKMVLIK